MFQGRYNQQHLDSIENKRITTPFREMKPKHMRRMCSRNTLEEFVWSDLKVHVGCVPFLVHPSMEKEACEGLERQEIGIWEVFCNERGYFVGESLELCHGKKTKIRDRINNGSECAHSI